jgi:hypothetical protein
MQALPQGSLFNVHPHTHALVPAGIMKGGVFYEQRNISTSVIAEIFRARLLTVLLEQGVITQELINKLFFGFASVYGTRLFQYPGSRCRCITAMIAY